jgi:Ribbon-helix-helix protein, copG family
MARNADESGELSETMKRLFPPRVELDRRQNRMLEELAGRSGKSVKELVREALERFLSGPPPSS